MLADAISTVCLCWHVPSVVCVCQHVPSVVCLCWQVPSVLCVCWQVPSAVQTKDPFNISNDEHYNPKVMDNALRPNIGSSLIQVCMVESWTVRAFLSKTDSVSHGGGVDVWSRHCIEDWEVGGLNPDLSSHFLLVSWVLWWASYLVQNVSGTEKLKSHVHL